MASDVDLWCLPQDKQMADPLKDDDELTWADIVDSSSAVEKVGTGKVVLDVEVVVAVQQRLVKRCLNCCIGRWLWWNYQHQIAADIVVAWMNLRSTQPVVVVVVVAAAVAAFGADTPVAAGGVDETIAVAPRVFVDL